jgi:hypothetical protein
MAFLYERLGSEFLVNTVTTGSQDQSRVVPLGDGFLVVWTDQSGTLPDTTWAIRAQRYGADGQPIGTEFLVNNGYPNNQMLPVAQQLPSGGFVIAWTNQLDIHARIFDANGSPVANEFFPTAVTTGAQSTPALAALGTGFVMAWEGPDGAGTGIKAQIYDSTGTRIGSEINVNTDTANSQLTPVVTTLSSGGFAVAWTDNANTSTNLIEMQLFDSAGNKIGGEISVAGAGTRPAITQLASGSILVTWQTGTDIVGRLYDSAGNPATSAFVVNTFGGNKSDPAVTALPSGGFVIAYSVDGAVDGSGTAIVARVFDAAGKRVGHEFVVNTATQNAQVRPSVTATGADGFVISWTDSSLQGGDASGTAIKAQRYTVSSVVANEVPEIDLNGSDPGIHYATVYTEDAPGVAVVGAGTVITDLDADGIIVSATVKITNTAGGDTLSVAGTLPVGISATVATVDGQVVLTLTGNGSHADYATALGQVRFSSSNLNRPAGNADRTLIVTVDDGKGDTASASSTVTVTSVNDAPVPTANSVMLAPIYEDNGSPGGAPISFLVSSIFSDADGNGPAGVAITNNPANAAQGVWQYSSDGSWISIGTRSESSALVLALETKLRFVPAVDFTGAAPALSAHLIDNSAGAVVTGAVVDATANGGTTVYSDTPISIHQSVTAVDALFERAGGEILVNTSTTSTQASPAVTKLASGGFVIVFHDFSASGGDTSAGAIKGQIFDAAGIKVGSEFLVNTQTIGSQTAPAVSALPTGGFVVGWTDGSAVGQDTSGSGVKAQIFDAAGGKVGSEFLVNTATNSAQQIPNIATLNSGGFVVTWIDSSLVGGDTSGTAIKAQIFDAAGVKSGGELLVNTTTSGNQSNPSVTALTSGGFVISFDTAQTVKAQVFDAAGVKVDGELSVSVTASHFHVNSEIVALPNGGFLVTWQGGDAAGSVGINGQVYNSAGLKVGSSFVINTTTLNSQNTPDIAVFPDGGFVVAWSDNSGLGNDLVDYGIKAQVFDATGAKVGTEFQVNSAGMNSQTIPVVDVLASGGFVISWSDASLEGGDASGSSVKAQVFLPSSGAVTDIALSHISVSETSVGNLIVGTLSATGAVNTVHSYKIVSDSTGGAFRIEGDKLVINNNHRLDFETATSATLKIRATGADGNSFDEVISVAVTDEVNETRYRALDEVLVNGITANAQTQSAMAALMTGGYVAVWTDNSQTAADTSNTGVKAQLHDASGNKIGAEFLVNTTVALGQDQPSVASLSSGGFVVTWRDGSLSGSDTSSTAVRGQVLDSSGAKVGGEFLLHTATANAQSQPIVSGLNNGGFIAVWTDGSLLGGDASGTGIKAQVFDAAGTKVGAEFRVNTTVTGAQDNPVVTTLNSGNVVVAWQDASDGSGTGVRARILNSSGAEVLAEFLVNTTTTGAQGTPTITALSTGGFVVSWRDDSTTGGDNASSSIKAQIYDANGAKVGSEYLVNTSIAGAQTDPQVDAMSDGRFVISWTDASGGRSADANVDTGVPGIRAQIFDATGAKIGTEFLVNQVKHVEQNESSLIVLNSGDFVVAWTDNSGAFASISPTPEYYADTSVSGIKSRLFTTALPPGPANAAPVIDLNGTNDADLDFATGYSEGGAGIPIVDADIVITDADAGDNLTAAVVTITDARTGDALSFDGTPPGAITFALNSTGTVLTLTGAGSHAEYAAALAQVRFGSSSQDPTAGGTDAQRTITITATDGTTESAPSTTTVTITAQNDEPSGTSATITALEDTHRVLAAADFGFSDVDGTLASIAISAVTGGKIFFDADGSGSASAPVEAMLPQTYTAADFAAGRVSFMAAPDAFGAATGTLTFAVTDNGGATDASSNVLTVDVTAVNDAPSGTNGSKTILEDSNHTFGEADFGFGDFEGDAFAGVEITTLATNGLLKLNGVAITAGQFVTAADIAADKLTFEPDANENGSDYASFTFKVRDNGATGGSNVNQDPSANSFTFNVTQVNDAPTFSPATVAAATFTEDGPTTALLQGVTIFDPDMPASFIGGSLTVSVSGTGNSLSLPNADGFSGSNTEIYYGNSKLADITRGESLTLTNFTAIATPAVMNLLIDNFRYQNTQEILSATTRTVTFTFSDGGNSGTGGALTTSISQTINLVPTNDRPFVGTSGTTTFTESAGPVSTAVLVDPTVSVADADNTSLASASVKFISGFVAGQDVLAFTSGAAFGNITGSYDAATGTLTLTSEGASATLAEFEAALRSVTYNNSSNAPTAGNRTIQFTVNDGALTGTSSGSRTITVVASNDAPVNTVPGAQSGTEDTNLIFSSAKGNAITVSDGDAADGDMTVTLSANSGRLTLATVAGLTSVSGNGSASVTLTGSATEINAALNGLAYRGNLNYEGSDTLTVTTSDNGLTGTGGAKSDTDTIAITLSDDGRINGDSGDNTLIGTPGDDFFYLQDGGNDSSFGLGGNDFFIYGAAFTSADANDGGDGSDAVMLQGDYSAGVTLGTNALVNVEGLLFASGSDTRFGDAGGNSYSYNATTVDANVAAGAKLTVNAATLLAGENFTFNGSAETDGTFFVYGGKGTDDITGGQGNDMFFFVDGRWNGGDKIQGGGGYDGMVIRGVYMGSTAVTFGANDLKSIEAIGLNSVSDFRFDPGIGIFGYELTLSEGNVGETGNLLITGFQLQATERMTVNGSAILTGTLSLYGGAGGDTLTGGSNGDLLRGNGGADLLRGNGGADTFQYFAATDSSVAASDQILDFTFGADKIDLTRIDADTTTAGDQAFSFIGQQAFGNHAGELRTVYDNIAGYWLVQGDIDGDGQADFQILVGAPNANTPFSSSDFFL